jgi:hypothetical protein
MGYELHRWLAVGHLAEAETESCSEFPEMANDIRKVRLALMGQEGIFHHNDLMVLLKKIRDIAERVNGISESEHMHRSIYPDKVKEV